MPSLAALQPYFLTAALLLAYAAEHLWPQRRSASSLRHDGVNLGIGILNLLLVTAAGYGLQQVFGWMETHKIGLLHNIALPPAAAVAIAFLALDGFMYSWHLANHRISLLWRFHAFHHKDEAMNSTTALRFHAVELALSYLVRIPVYLLLGVDAGILAVYNIIFSAVVIFHHSAVRLHPVLDAALRIFIVTPGLHRIHHSTRFRETDSNFGSVLPWWDVVFGTRVSRPAGAITFGIPHSRA